MNAGPPDGVQVGFQVTVDCTDPYRQAVFWSQLPLAAISRV